MSALSFLLDGGKMFLMLVHVESPSMHIALSKYTADWAGKLQYLSPCLFHSKQYKVNVGLVKILCDDVKLHGSQRFSHFLSLITWMMYLVVVMVLAFCH